jgi:glycogen operon protein
MVMDSLRYWVEICHVDGFRFDLAVTLGRTANGFDAHSAFFAAIRQDPVLAKVKLIAEPWDLGPGGYQVGHFPPEWSEWNDAFRRTLRRYWRGEGDLIGDLSTRMTASSDLFRRRHRAPRAGINHITVHDGFTLADLVSYSKKHNEANGQDNHDGADENWSTNCGAEGPSDDPKILELRRTLRRNLLASLFLAQGVPLLLAGDEVGNSQSGNNNPFCQDNETGWIDWRGLGNSDEDFSELIGHLTGLRRKFPQLRPRHWLIGKRRDGSLDVLWLTPRGTEMSDRDWMFPEARYLSYVLAPPDENGAPLFIVLNAAEHEIGFVMPVWPNASHWVCMLETTPMRRPPEGRFWPGLHCEAPARSVLAFEGAK